MEGGNKREEDGGTRGEGREGTRGERMGRYLKMATTNSLSYHRITESLTLKSYWPILHHYGHQTNPLLAAE